MQLNQNAQGTIEYLVILAVIIVISLVVVSMLVGLTDSQDITRKNDKLGNMIGTGGISITEAVLDDEGNALITVKNLGSDTLTITDVSGGSTTINFDQTQPGFGHQTFYLTGLSTYCPCDETVKERVCNFTITRTNKHGNSESIPLSINISCVDEVIPTNPGDIVGLGDGSVTNPFVINSCQELQNMDQNLTASYKLGADINCAETLTWNSETGFSPIGTSASRFRGSFNGNNNTINNLYFYRPSVGINEATGLFGFTIDANINNVILTDANIIGNRYVGGLIGDNIRGNITNNQINGNLTGDLYVGGLIGDDSNGIITNNQINGNITGTYDSGGLVGRTYYATITNNYATGTINGTDNIGGLVGKTYYATIISNKTSENVTGINNSIGGLVGWNYRGSIINNYTTGIVNAGQNFIGGIVGYTTISTIKNNYTTGTINGFWHNGGIIGQGVGVTLVANNFSVASINGTNFNGGLSGYYTGSSITNNYWDINLTGRSNCYNGSNDGCTSTDNNAIAYYGTTGIPFNILYFDNNWVAQDNNYPKLVWE
jgi:hypothetical protein